jgi:hypothetical protein
LLLVQGCLLGATLARYGIAWACSFDCGWSLLLHPHC